MSNKIFKIVKEYALMTIALAIYVFGWTAFIIPNGFPGGGVAGLASIVYYGFNIPIDYTYFTLNAVLLVIGFAVLGKGFGIKTIFCIIVTTLLFKYMPLIPWKSDISEMMINAIIGGILSGIGIAIVFKQGGSTGGTDVIALIINKYRDITPGKVFLFTDSLIISSILLLPDKGLENVIYGLIELVSFTYTVDLVLTGTQQCVQIMIMSAKNKEIADTLCHKMGRGVTAIRSMGWYTQSDKDIIMVVSRKNTMQDVMDTIKKTDKNAFITVSSVMGVYGKGFRDA